MDRRQLIVTAAGLALATSGLVVAPGAALAAPATCQGKPVTIVATQAVTRGTEGDDVVAMEPGAWNAFDALGGDDTICLDAAADVESDVGRRAYGTLEAGAGDDVVVNLTPVGYTGMTTVVLGTGNDTYRGADLGETVFADLRVADFDDPDLVDPALVGSQRDVVTGASTVFSTAPNDGPNEDRITFGTRDARAVVAGPMAASALLDVSAAPRTLLEVRSVRRLAPGAADVLVDARTGTASAGATPVLSWTGDVQTFVLGTPRRAVGGPTVSFSGSDGDESLVLSDVPIGDVSMGAGDDAMTVESWNTSYVPRRTDGGRGHDSALVSAVCRDALAVRVGRTATCDGTGGPFVGFREVIVSSEVTGSRTDLVGSRRSERLVASGDVVTVRGHGGDDEIGVDDSASARVWAGRGADRVWVSGDDVVVRGQAGRDRIELLGTAGVESGTRIRKQQVALGGAGADVLLGTTSRPDRLVGGPGRDRADGRAGSRDYCSAEVTRRCERP